MAESLIQTLLVPAGAEYQAVCRGQRRAFRGALPGAAGPQVVAVPAGPQAVAAFLQAQPLPPGGVVLLGLGGSLTPDYGIGDVVLWQQALAIAGREIPRSYSCDRALMQALQRRLINSSVGVGLTCDRVISCATEKQRLAAEYGAQVVDMEGAAVLWSLPQSQPAAIVRVISDDCGHDLPDLSQAIGADGRLRSLPLALSFLRQPTKALRLIRGSLQGLAVLATISQTLCTPARPAD